MATDDLYVVKIRKSMESIIPDSFIVLERDSEDSQTHTVNRWWRNSEGAITTETVFKTSEIGSISDVYVFDNFALALVDDSAIKVIHFKDFRGDVVPPNYGITLVDASEIVSAAIVPSLEDVSKLELFLAIR